MAGKSQHVVPRGSGWGVLTSGASRASKVFATQSEAIDEARAKARRKKTELYIHGANGLIRERNSYSLDPFPPRG